MIKTNKKSLFGKIVTIVSFHRALSDFNYILRPIYLKALGFTISTIFKTQGIQLLILTFLDAPISAYADKFSRKIVLFLATILQMFSVILTISLSFGNFYTNPIFILYITDLLLALSKNILSISLDSIAINNFISNKTDNEYKYSDYLYHVQRYSLILKLLSFIIAIFTSYISYITYLIFSVLGNFVQLFLIKNLSQEIEQKNTQDNRYITGILKHIILSIKEIINSKWGKYALLANGIVGVLRTIIVHNGIAAIFFNKVSVSSKLDKKLTIPLLIANFGLFIIGNLFNKKFKTSRNIKKITKFIFIGSLSSLFVMFSNHPKLVFISIPAFWITYSCLDMAMMGIHNLFSKSVNKERSNFMHTIMHASGRLFSSIILYKFIKSIKFLQGPYMFIISSIGLAILIPLLIQWDYQLKNSNSYNENKNRILSS